MSDSCNPPSDIIHYHMKIFEEYFNLDGKDALESPLLKAAVDAYPEERYLHVNYDNETVVNTNVNLNNSILSSWDVQPTDEATVKDTTAMVCSPQMPGLDLQTWFADFIYPNNAFPPSAAPPMSAQPFATPCETPALLDSAFLDRTTSPEFNNSLMFAPASTTTSPTWKTSPRFGGATFSPVEQLGFDDPIVALGLGLQDTTLTLFPEVDTTTSSSFAAAAESASGPTVEQLLRSFATNGAESEPSVSVPMSVLRAMVEHMSKCTCGQSAHSTPSIYATTTTTSTTSSSVVPPFTMEAEVDPFAVRRRRVPNKLYLCSHTGCGKTFTRRFNLQTHEATHNPNRARDHVCEMCAKRFTRSHDLTRHMTVHAEEKHECEGCGKGYSRSDALRRHAERCEGFTGVQKKMLPTLITLK